MKKKYFINLKILFYNDKEFMARRMERNSV